MTGEEGSDVPYQQGARVSAKHRGAFCEAEILEVLTRRIDLKVRLRDGTKGTRTVVQESVKGEIRPAAEVLVRDGDSENYLAAVVVQLIDRCDYRVLFDDGEVHPLNGRYIKSRGESSFKNGSLNTLPFDDPMKFAQPVTHAPSSESASESSGSEHEPSEDEEEEEEEEVVRRPRKRRARPFGSRRQRRSGARKRRKDADSSSPEHEHGDGEGEGEAGTEKEDKLVKRRAPAPSRRRGGVRARRETEHADSATEELMKQLTSEEIEGAFVYRVGDKVTALSYYDGQIYNGQIISRELRVAGRRGRGSGRMDLNRNPPIPHYRVHYKGWSEKYEEWVTEEQILDSDRLQLFKGAVSVVKGPDRGDESTSSSDEGGGGKSSPKKSVKRPKSPTSPPPEHPSPPPPPQQNVVNSGSEDEKPKRISEGKPKKRRAVLDYTSSEEEEVKPRSLPSRAFRISTDTSGAEETIRQRDVEVKEVKEEEKKEVTGVLEREEEKEEKEVTRVDGDKKEGDDGEGEREKEERERKERKKARKEKKKRRKERKEKKKKREMRKDDGSASPSSEEEIEGDLEHGHERKRKKSKSKEDRKEESEDKEERKKKHKHRSKRRSETVDEGDETKEVVKGETREDEETNMEVGKVESKKTVPVFKDFAQETTEVGNEQKEENVQPSIVSENETPQPSPPISPALPMVDSQPSPLPLPPPPTTHTHTHTPTPPQPSSPVPTSPPITHTEETTTEKPPTPKPTPASPHLESVADDMSPQMGGSSGEDLSVDVVGVGVGEVKEGERGDAGVMEGEEGGVETEVPRVLEEEPSSVQVPASGERTSDPPAPAPTSPPSHPTPLEGILSELSQTTNEGESQVSPLDIIHDHPDTPEVNAHYDRCMGEGVEREEGKKKKKKGHKTTADAEIMMKGLEGEELWSGERTRRRRSSSTHEPPPLNLPPPAQPTSISVARKQQHLKEKGVVHGAEHATTDEIDAHAHGKVSRRRGKKQVEEEEEGGEGEENEEEHTRTITIRSIKIRGPRRPDAEEPPKPKQRRAPKEKHADTEKEREKEKEKTKPQTEAVSALLALQGQGAMKGASDEHSPPTKHHRAPPNTTKPRARGPIKSRAAGGAGSGETKKPPHSVPSPRRPVPPSGHGTTQHADEKGEDGGGDGKEEAAEILARMGQQQQQQNTTDPRNIARQNPYSREDYPPGSASENIQHPPAPTYGPGYSGPHMDPNAPRLPTLGTYMQPSPRSDLGSVHSPLAVDSDEGGVRTAGKLQYDPGQMAHSRHGSQQQQHLASPASSVSGSLDPRVRQYGTPPVGGVFHVPSPGDAQTRQGDLFKHSPSHQGDPIMDDRARYGQAYSAPPMFARYGSHSEMDARSPLATLADHAAQATPLATSNQSGTPVSWPQPNSGHEQPQQRIAPMGAPPPGHIYHPHYHPPHHIHPQQHHHRPVPFPDPHAHYVTHPAHYAREPPPQSPRFPEGIPAHAHFDPYSRQRHMVTAGFVPGYERGAMHLHASMGRRMSQGYVYGQGVAYGPPPGHMAVDGEGRPIGYVHEVDPSQEYDRARFGYPGRAYPTGPPTSGPPPGYFTGHEHPPSSGPSDFHMAEQQVFVRRLPNGEKEYFAMAPRNRLMQLEWTGSEGWRIVREVPNPEMHLAGFHQSMAVPSTRAGPPSSAPHHVQSLPPPSAHRPPSSPHADWASSPGSYAQPDSQQDMGVYGSRVGPNEPYERRAVEGKMQIGSQYAVHKPGPVIQSERLGNPISTPVVVAQAVDVDMSTQHSPYGGTMVTDQQQPVRSPHTVASLSPRGPQVSSTLSPHRPPSHSSLHQPSPPPPGPLWQQGQMAQMEGRSPGRMDGGGSAMSGERKELTVEMTYEHGGSPQP